MEEYRTQFLETLHQFLTELSNNTVSEGVNNFLKVFEAEQLDTDLIIKRYHKIATKFEEQIKDKDETMFERKVKILPGINLSAIWGDLDEEQKSRTWIHLKILLTISVLISTHEDGFNAYSGVGSNSVSYGIEQMNAGPELIEQNEDGDLLGGLAGMTIPGLSNMLNLDGLKEKLNEISPEDIKKAKDGFKKMMPDMDDNMSGLLSDMVTNITDELKNGNVSNANPVGSIVKIAENVAGKIGPQMQERNITQKQLFESTKQMANGLGGNSAVISNMMDKMMNGQGPSPSVMQSMMKQIGKVDGGEMQRMMEEMGKEHKKKGKKGGKRGKKRGGKKRRRRKHKG